MFGGSYEAWLHARGKDPLMEPRLPFAKRFEDEVRSAHERIVEDFQDNETALAYRRKLARSGKSREEANRSIVALILQDLERQVLTCMLDSLRAFPGVKPNVLLHDGLFVRTDATTLPADLLTSLESDIKAKTGFVLGLKIKPLRADPMSLSLPLSRPTDNAAAHARTRLMRLGAFKSVAFRLGGLQSLLASRSADIWLMSTLRRRELVDVWVQLDGAPQ